MRRQRRSSQAGAGRHRGRYRWQEKPGGECGPVTITRADGTVEVQPAKKPRAPRKRAAPRRRSGPSKVFAAAWATTCCGCGELISPGTLVCFDQFDQLLHDNCLMPQERPDPWAAGPTEAQG